MTEKRPRWVITTSAKLSFTLGILWLLFGLMWVTDAVIGSKAAPLPWISATGGFVLSLAYLTSGWWLRRHPQQ